MHHAIRILSAALLAVVISSCGKKEEQAAGGGMMDQVQLAPFQFMVHSK